MLHVAALIWLARGARPGGRPRADRRRRRPGAGGPAGLAGGPACRGSGGDRGDPGARRRAAPGGRHDGAGGHGHAAAARQSAKKGLIGAALTAMVVGLRRPALTRRAARPATLEPRPGQAQGSAPGRGGSVIRLAPRISDQGAPRRARRRTPPCWPGAKAAGTLLMNRAEDPQRPRPRHDPRLPEAIEAWKDDASVEAGRAGRGRRQAFCAGGDVRAVRESGDRRRAPRRSRPSSPRNMRVNRGIATFGKPWVSPHRRLLHGRRHRAFGA